MKIDQDDPRTAGITITDLTDSVIQAYLYAITGDDYVARGLTPHLGMDYTGKVGE